MYLRNYQSWSRILSLASIAWIYLSLTSVVVSMLPPPISLFFISSRATKSSKCLTRWLRSSSYSCLARVSPTLNPFRSTGSRISAFLYFLLAELTPAPAPWPVFNCSLYGSFPLSIDYILSLFRFLLLYRSANIEPWRMLPRFLWLATLCRLRCVIFTLGPSLRFSVLFRLIPLFCS